jgi:hypothetical protein
VQLAWGDVPANLAASKALVNDLDLVVTAPDHTVYLGNDFNARSGTETPSTPNATTPNSVDNIEGVDVPAPQAGQWSVDVRARNVPFGPQKFALVTRGSLAAAPTAAMHVDRSAYRTNGNPVKVAVFDPGRSSSATAHIATDKNPSGTDIALSPDGSAPGVFVGQAALGDAGSSPLPTADGDHVSITYADSGGGVESSSAVVDNVAPTFSDTNTTAITPFGGTVHAVTSEPAVGLLDVYPSNADPTPVAANNDANFVTDRSISVNSLDGGTRYYYRTRADDVAGNEGVDDDGGLR